MRRHAWQTGARHADRCATPPTRAPHRASHRAVCDACTTRCTAHRQYVHLLLPHVVANPLALGILTHPDFPLVALGGVHSRASIRQVNTARL